MRTIDKLVRRNRRYAKSRWGSILGVAALDALRNYSEEFQFSAASGDLLFLDKGWYVTNAGLTRLARRNRCAGVHVQPVPEFSDPATSRWAFKATVYKSRSCKGFVGYGDADPSNISPLVHGAEMRVAETRAVNRALRKAYGIGICSVERSVPLPKCHNPLESRRSSRHSLLTGTMAAPRSATASARSSVSINSILTL